MQRLELQWRPNHIYSKPTCGDRHSVTNLLLRVRRRKKKSSGLDPGGDSSKVMDDYEYEGRVLGVIDTVYKFQCKLFCAYGDVPKLCEGSVLNTDFCSCRKWTIM